MLRKITISIAALVASYAVAAGQTVGPNFPILGGASYCTSTVNNVCVATVPAGPAMSGSETIPTDTNSASGQTPQTVKAPIALLGAGPYVYNAPLTGASITLAGTTRRLVLEPAGTIATLTVVTPAATALIDGQQLGICTTQIVTALTVTAGSGTTILNAPTALQVPVATGPSSCVNWIYRVANTSWYRTQ